MKYCNDGCNGHIDNRRGCESNRVKENRKTYRDFLKNMSDAPEFLKIISEKVNDDNLSNMYLVVEFETKYCGRELRDNHRLVCTGFYAYYFHLSFFSSLLSRESEDKPIFYLNQDDKPWTHQVASGTGRSQKSPLRAVILS